MAAKKDIKTASQVPSSPVKFEFMVLDDTYTHMEEMLNVYGEDGWDMASLIIRKEYNQFTAVMKRMVRK